MTGPLARATAALVATPRPRPASAPSSSDEPPAVAVVGCERGAPRVAEAVVTQLRLDHRAPVAVVLGTRPAPAAWTAPSARKLAARLTDRGIAATAAAHAVHADLAGSDRRATLHRVRAAVTGAPVVTVVPGMRDDATDALLAEHDRIVAVLPADAPPELDGLVAGSLEALGPPVTTTRAVPSRPSALLVRAGMLRPRSPLPLLRASDGQSAIALVGLMLAVAAGVLVAGAVGAGAERAGGAQRAADLAALAGARAMRDAYPRLFFAPGQSGALSRAGYEQLGRHAAGRTAGANGAGDVRITFPDGASGPPLRIRVTIRELLDVTFARERERTTLTAVAEAELAPGTGAGLAAYASGGGYRGRLAYRQGKPMRPDVALAFDRMERAARASGVALIINSGYRTDAEQAVLWARNPDPMMVAPPGRSLHRNATELDLGPASAYGWLAVNALRFGFLKRYPHEGWHFGYIANARSRPTTSRGAGDGRGHASLYHGSAMPSFVPERYAPIIARAAQRWNVSAALLAAQIHQESRFEPRAVSRSGAQGIAQFMPATAAGYGLRDPFDAEAAIDAQAHFMHDLLRQFSAVPLALAAYNAGPGAVAACMCIPSYPETRQYVALILGLLGGTGDLLGPAAGGFDVRLVR